MGSFAKESPKSSQCVIHRPMIVTVPCMLRSMPLLRGLHISDWCTGMFERLKPFPMPGTIRPTRS